MSDETSQAADELRQMMCDISERGYCAGWMQDLEFDLWDLVLRGGGQYARADVTPGEAATLRALAERCGGWMAWADDDTDDVLVPLPEWERRFAEHVANRS